MYNRRASHIAEYESEKPGTTLCYMELGDGSCLAFGGVWLGGMIKHCLLKSTFANVNPDGNKTKLWPCFVPDIESPVLIHTKLNLGSSLKITDQPL